MIVGEGVDEECQWRGSVPAEVAVLEGPVESVRPVKPPHPRQTGPGRASRAAPGVGHQPGTRAQNVRNVGVVKHGSKTASRAASDAGRAALGSIGGTP